MQERNARIKVHFAPSHSGREDKCEEKCGGQRQGLRCILPPLPEGEVEVTKDGATEITKAEKAPRTKQDPLKMLEDFSKLPVAVHIGQVAMSVEEYSGRAVLSLSLVGWVGEAPFKILAADVTELEDALANLRKQLS